MDISFRIYSGFSRYHIFENGIVFDNNLKRKLPYQISKDGYHCVTLRNDSAKRKTFKVHRLVAYLFVENPCHKPEVNHKNGIKSDNHCSNLEWVTHAENIQHAWNNGLIKNTPQRSRKLSEFHSGRKIGRENPKSKKVVCLTTGEIFNSQREAAKSYNICQSQISCACSGYKNRKTAGKHRVNGEPLKWSILNDQL